MSDTHVSPNPFQEVASKSVEQVRTLKSLVEGFRDPRTQADLTSAIIRAAQFPDALLQSVALAVDTLPELASVAAMPADELRATVSFANAFLPVVRELEQVTRALRYTIAVRRGRAGRAAQRVYQQTKALRREPDGAKVAPIVTSLQAVQRRRRRAAPADPAQSPAQSQSQS
jgi:hypothetical protein